MSIIVLESRTTMLSALNINYSTVLNIVYEELQVL